MTSRIFFLQRVNDHLQYLNQINETLENDRCFEEQTHIDCFKGTSELECQLGRWFYGEGSTEITVLKNPRIKALFDGLFEPHTRFHAISKEAINKRQAGDKKGAQAAVAEMKKISNLLTSHMLQLETLLQKEGVV
jgi:hypothetical protein